MATRTISTKLAVEGESEYKKAVAACNTELSTLKSSLSLTESAFKGNANSMEALTSKGSALSSMYDKQKEKVSALEEALKNAQAAQTQYSERVASAKENVERCGKALEDLKNSTGDTAEEQKALTEEINRWNAELSAAEGYEAAAERGVQNWKKQLNYAKIDLNDLSDEVERNNQYLDEAKESADGCATSIDKYGKEVKDAGANAKNAGEDSAEFGNKSEKAISDLSSALAAAGIAATLKEIAEALKACVDASTEFESAIAGVYKTVDGSEEQLSAISSGIKQMSTELPSSTTEIAAVAEAAGQLGIKTEDILSFTRTMIDLGESTNLSAEEAATALAKFANITGTAAEDYNRLGSVVVGLGNNFATTEADIVAMSTRLASAGTLAGMSETDIIALAAAMSSVGIEAEAGGTAMTQTLTAIETAAASGGESLDQFASIAGMSSQEFANMWETNAVGALQQFIAGLGNLDAQGESATIVLDEMGLSGVRQSNMLKSLALASDQLSGAVSFSSDEWARNTALTDEAAKRYATTESRFTMCENAATNLKAAIGDALTPALADLADAGTDGFSWAADFIEKNPWIIQALTGVIVAVSVLAVGVTAYTVVTKYAAVVQGIFNTALIACPVIAVAAGIAGLVVAIGAFISSVGSADEETKEFTKSLEESKTAYDDLSASIEEEQKNTDALTTALEEALEVEGKTAAQKEAILEMVDQLNEAVPELGLSYDAMTDSINMTNESLDALVEHGQAQEEYEAQVARLSELYVEQADISARLTEAQNTYNAAVDSGAWGTGTLKNNVEELTAAQQANVEEIAALEAASAEYGEWQQASKTATAEMTATVNDLISEMDALQISYENAKQKATESIEGQLGLFNELDGSAKTSIDSLIETLKGQCTYMDEYAENINKAMELGVDQGLIQKLSDGSEESAQILASIVQGGEEDIQALNEQLARVDEGKEKFSSTVAEMETDFSSKMSALETRLGQTVTALNVSVEAGASGAATVQGYIDGAESMRSQLTAKYRNLALAANAAFNAALEIHSPSRVAMQSGSNYIKGDIIGAEMERANLERTYEGLARSAYSAYERGRPSATEEPSAAAAQRAQTDAIVSALKDKPKGGGDTYVSITSPEALDERAAAREFKKAQRDLSLGLT